MTSSNEKWVVVFNESEFKIAQLTNRATLGRAASNHYYLADKKLKSIEGYFLLKQSGWNFFSFSTGHCDPIESRPMVLSGGWKLQALCEKSLWDQFGGLALKKFKDSYLAEATGSKSNDSLGSYLPSLFLNSNVSALWRKKFQDHFSEVRLNGPIEQLMSDESLTDILVNSEQDIWVQRSGQLLKTDLSFTSKAAYNIYIENLLIKYQKTLDFENPSVDFLLDNGARIHLIGPPLTKACVYLSIRKFPKVHQCLDDLLELKMMTEETFQLLKSATLEKKNIIIAGATGSGKTTLIRALLKEVPTDERIVVLEDSPELGLQRSNCVSLQSSRDVSLRALLKESLRMRPDRLVIGEVRGEESYELLQAFNTGHKGGVSSIHANSARDSLWRLLSLVRLNFRSLSESATMDLIARNIELVIFVRQRPCGLRQIDEIHEVKGAVSNEFVLEKLF